MQTKQISKKETQVHDASKIEYTPTAKPISLNLHFLTKIEGCKPDVLFLFIPTGMGPSQAINGEIFWFHSDTP